jgi:tubulin-folding cofactor B
MSIVRVTLSHPATGGMVMEKRLALTSTIEQIKQSCATHFQTPIDAMDLKLRDETGAVVEASAADDKLLGYYQVRDGWTIDVVDRRGKEAQYVGLKDDGSVEKFTISDTDYLKRPDNARAFKEQCIARMNAERVARGETLPEQLTDESFKEQADVMKAGDRCQVQPGDRLGTVRYVGRIAALKPGYWIGVEYDEPVGKSDGSIKGGPRVFECRPLYGGFVRPDAVEVGDFPEEEF